MKNPTDYESGWTTPTINPKTGKKCSGGAARNLRTAQAGGATGIYKSGFIAAMEYVTPLFQKMENELHKSQELNQNLLKGYEAAISKEKNR